MSKQTMGNPIPTEAELSRMADQYRPKPLMAEVVQFPIGDELWETILRAAKSKRDIPKPNPRRHMYKSPCVHGVARSKCGPCYVVVRKRRRAIARLVRLLRDPENIAILKQWHGATK